MAQNNPFGARARLASADGEVTYFRLDALARQGIADVSRLPMTIKVLLENVLRRCDGQLVDEQDVADLAAMRSAMARMGGDPQRINPLVPADLVIDHSVQVDYFGSALAYSGNVQKEIERNRERYMLLRWAQRAFRNFTVVPPGMGIVHQVNLEYLGRVVQVRQED